MRKRIWVYLVTYKENNMNTTYIKFYDISLRNKKGMNCCSILLFLKKQEGFRRYAKWFLRYAKWFCIFWAFGWDCKRHGDTVVGT